MTIATSKSRSATIRVEYIDQTTPSISEESIGLKIRSLRRAAGMSLRELGDAIGVSLVQLQRYETCASKLSTARLLAISKVLAVPISSLFGETHFSEPDCFRNRHNQEERELSRLFAGLTEPLDRQTILHLVRTAAARENLLHARAESLPPKDAHNLDIMNREIDR